MTDRSDPPPLPSSPPVPSPPPSPSVPPAELLLARGWGLTGAAVGGRLPGGMTSWAWPVSDGARRWVLKVVPESGAGVFGRGLEVAARLERAGVPAGGARVTVDGGLVVVAHGWAAALLAWVDGEELTGRDEVELRLIGRTLGLAHLALGTDPAPAASPAPPGVWSTMRPRIDLSAPYLGVRPWIRPAVTAAVAAAEALGPATLTWGPIHGDPAPEAFLLDRSRGVCGLIDWGAAGSAPRVFDLASAVMYAGGSARAGALVAAYVDTGAVSGAEVARALPVMAGYRWAVQADFFAERVVLDPGDAENEKGLADARAGLAEAAAVRGEIPGGR